VSLGAVPVILSKGVWSILEGSDFYTEFKPLPGAEEIQAATDVHGLTADYLEENGQEPELALEDFEKYINQVKRRHGKCVPAAWPSSFDSPYVGWYFQKFLGHNPLGYGAFDIPSFAQGIFRCGKGELRSKMARIGLPVRENPYPHHALRDAREQAKMLVKLLNHPSAEGIIP